MWQRYNQTGHIFEKSVDNGATWVPLPLNGAIITEGPIHIKAAPSIFESPILGLIEYRSSAGPLFWFNFTAGAVNEKYWRMYTNPAGMTFDCVTDDGGTIITKPLVLRRDGDVVVERDIYSRAQLVALRSINNNFTAQQNINTPTIAELQLNQTDGTVFRLLSYQNSFWVYPHLRVDTLSNLIMQGAIYERARTTPLGDWLTGDLTTGYTMAGVSGTIKWSIVGKTMFLVSIMTVYLPASASYIWLNIPAGQQNAFPAGHVMTMQYYPGTIWTPGISVPNGPTQLLLYTNNQAAWPANTTMYVTLNLTIPLL